jgi:hypothetical protein
MKNINKKKERRNWYKLSNVFINIIRFNNKQITLWTNIKQDYTKYQLLIWKDDSGVCFKFGKTYGFNSCWETILPKQKSILVPGTN